MRLCLFYVSNDIQESGPEIDNFRGKKEGVTVMIAAHMNSGLWVVLQLACKDYEYATLTKRPETRQMVIICSELGMDIFIIVCIFCTKLWQGGKKVITIMSRLKKISLMSGYVGHHERISAIHPSRYSFNLRGYHCVCNIHLHKISPQKNKISS